MSNTTRKSLEARRVELRAAFAKTGAPVPQELYAVEQDRVLAYADLLGYAMSEFQQIENLKSGTASSIAQEALDHINAEITRRIP